MSHATPGKKLTLSDEQRVELEARIAGGESLRSIAPEFGVSDVTFRKELRPEVRKAVNARNAAYPEAPDVRRERDLRRLDQRRDTCQQCGKPRGRGSEKKGPGICTACRTANAHEHDEKIIALYADPSLTVVAIADRLGMTPGAVRQAIRRLRAAGQVGRRYRPAGSAAGADTVGA